MSKVQSSRQGKTYQVSHQTINWFVNTSACRSKHLAENEFRGDVWERWVRSRAADKVGLTGSVTKPSTGLSTIRPAIKRSIGLSTKYLLAQWSNDQPIRQQCIHLLVLGQRSNNQPVCQQEPLTRAAIKRSTSLSEIMTQFWRHGDQCICWHRMNEKCHKNGRTWGYEVWSRDHRQV